MELRLLPARTQDKQSAGEQAKSSRSGRRINFRRTYFAAERKPGHTCDQDGHSECTNHVFLRVLPEWNYDFFRRERKMSNPPASRPRAAAPDEASISGATALVPANANPATLVNKIATPSARIIAVRHRPCRQTG
jgi:hypothetical protein